jgi:hypothetical protein
MTIPAPLESLEDVLKRIRQTNASLSEQLQAFAEFTRRHRAEFAGAIDRGGPAKVKAAGLHRGRASKAHIPGGLNIYEIGVPAEIEDRFYFVVTMSMGAQPMPYQQPNRAKTMPVPIVTP